MGKAKYVPVHFEFARADQCRYPLWDSDQKVGHVCGQKKTDGRFPWCAEHERIVYPLKEQKAQ